MGNVYAGEYGVGDACGWSRRGEEVLWVKSRRFQCVLHGQSQARPKPRAFSVWQARPEVTSLSGKGVGLGRAWVSHVYHRVLGL
jgi:hypothetical protein